MIKSPLSVAAPNPRLTKARVLHYPILSRIFSVSRESVEPLAVHHGWNAVDIEHSLNSLLRSTLCAPSLRDHIMYALRLLVHYAVLEICFAVTLLEPSRASGYKVGSYAIKPGI